MRCSIANEASPGNRGGRLKYDGPLHVSGLSLRFGDYENVAPAEPTWSRSGHIELPAAESNVDRVASEQIHDAHRKQQEGRLQFPRNS